MTTQSETGTPSTQYSVYEAGSDNPLFGFDKLTGGDQVISMVQYNVTDENGNVTTKFIPGQTSFDPIHLLRALDYEDNEMNNRFKKSVAGMLKSVRQNYSISLNDGEAKPKVWWHLINAIPSKIAGFRFNSVSKAYYSMFELTLHAESIEIILEPPEEE